jgi:hypothetical protein
MGFRLECWRKCVADVDGHLVVESRGGPLVRAISMRRWFSRALAGSRGHERRCRRRRQLCSRRRRGSVSRVAGGGWCGVPRRSAQPYRGFFGAHMLPKLRRAVILLSTSLTARYVCVLCYPHCASEHSERWGYAPTENNQGARKLYARCVDRKADKAKRLSDDPRVHCGSHEERISEQRLDPCQQQDQLGPDLLVFFEMKGLLFGR